MHYILNILFIAVLISGCNSGYSPKPRGYFRIDLPEKKYRQYNTECPFTFLYPVYAEIRKQKKDSCWFDIAFPKLNGRIYLSYKPVSGNLNKYLEDSHTLIHKHTIKADAIKEKLFIKDTSRVYGILFEIKGNVASSIQFHLTDSTRHFIRGALYFNAVPNKDSLAPVLNFIKKDIILLIESFEWKNKGNQK